jgi:hypothetical protein
VSGVGLIPEGLITGIATVGDGTGTGDGSGGTMTGGVVLTVEDMIAIVLGADGDAESMTLGFGFSDARPTPINMRFESSSSRGQGFMVKFERRGVKEMMSHASAIPSTRLASSSIYFLLEKSVVPCLCVGLDLGTSGSVLLTHTGPICARH